MFLKTLEMHGFKSFPDKTKLSFDTGLTVVVGPNGSGKSNIADAMKWVLGEISSKNLRGSRMEDVIFGGTETRKQMGFAEVTVTFDNTDSGDGIRLATPYDEVSVTRRFYRAGDSEYFINEKTYVITELTGADPAEDPTGTITVTAGNSSCTINLPDTQCMMYAPNTAGTHQVKAEYNTTMKRQIEIHHPAGVQI